MVTIDKSSLTVLSVRRNWYEDDSKKRKRPHFVHYRYLPGLAPRRVLFILLVALLVPALLRQLIDAGTLSNLPAGLKARGFVLKATIRLSYKEFRDWTYRRKYRDRLHSFLTRNLIGTISTEISWKRGDGLAPFDTRWKPQPTVPVGTTLARWSAA